MMDPIKVDVEVSAENSRLLDYRDVVDVIIPQTEQAESGSAGQSGTTSIRAIVYTIDPVADPATRTFTVTLLTQNQKFDLSLPTALPVQSSGLATFGN